MADNIKIPGVGSVPKKYVLIGGVAVVGIAGVFWLRYLRNPEPVADTSTTTDYTGEVGDETVYPAYSTDYAPDASYDGGAYPYPTYTTPSYGLTSTVQTADPITNSEWTQRSIEHLELLGVESQAGSLAVSRYLLKECVTSTQADLVRQAVAALGPPPQGTYSIIVCPTTPTQQQDDTPPPQTSQPTTRKFAGKVSGLRVKSVGSTSALIDWQPAAHSEGYGVYVNGVRRYEPRWSSQTVSGLRPNTSYQIGVVPRPDAGYSVPDMTTITVKTKK